MRDMESMHDVLRRMARGSPWRQAGAIDFVPSPKGREALEKAVARRRAEGRPLYNLSDAARDILDWAVSQAEAMRRK